MMSISGEERMAAPDIANKFQEEVDRNLTQRPPFESNGNAALQAVNSEIRHTASGSAHPNAYIPAMLSQTSNYARHGSTHQSSSSPVRTPLVYVEAPLGCYSGSLNTHNPTSAASSAAANSATASSPPVVLVPLPGTASSSSVKPFVRPPTIGKEKQTNNVTPRKKDPSGKAGIQKVKIEARHILPGTGHQNNHTPLLTQSPTYVRHGPITPSVSPIRTPVVYLEATGSRYSAAPSIHGGPNAVASSSTTSPTVSSAPVVLVPMPTSTSPTSIKSFGPRPTITKEKHLNTLGPKGKEPAAKMAIPKVKTEPLDMPSSPVKAVDGMMLNGTGTLYHSSSAQKRSAGADEGVSMPPKRRPKKKRSAETTQPSSFSPPGASAAVPTSPPTPILSEVPLSRPKSAGIHPGTAEDDVPDLFCHDKFSATSPPPTLGNGTSTALASGNGAFCKKTRLIYDSGVRKIQQINHENHASTTPAPVVSPSPEKSIIASVSPSGNSMLDLREGKKPRRPRKPREKQPYSRSNKPKKPKSVITIPRIVPVSLQLKHSENEDQKTDRLRRLATRWSSLSEDQRQWLLATKSVNQLKIFRWLRLVDRAYSHADSAKNFDKMERLRDSKIHAIMDLEKLQAPCEPRLMHFLHSDDVEKKARLIKKHFSGEEIGKKDLTWLREHYGRLCAVEQTLPGLGASTDSGNDYVPMSLPSLLPGNARGNFQQDGSTMSADSSASTSSSDASRVMVLQPNDFTTVQAAHQFIRKFPDSTKALVEVKTDGIPCAVLLLFQLPNSKAVHIKKHLKEPPGGFESKENAFRAAAALLDHLVVKYLCLPSYPVHVRYPLSPGYLNELFPSNPAAPSASQWSFNKDLHGWETVQYISSSDLLSTRPPSSKPSEAELPPENTNPPQSLTEDYRHAYPSCLSENDPVYQKFEKEIATKNTINLTAMANDPVGQRQWLSWECRHISKQYFDLDTCHQNREKWVTNTIDVLKTETARESTLARVSRLMELTRDGVKKPKNSTTTITKTIKVGEQVKEILESYKKERPMTRRKKAAISAAARVQLADR